MITKKDLAKWRRATKKRLDQIKGYSPKISHEAFWDRIYDEFYPDGRVLSHEVIQRYDLVRLLKDAKKKNLIWRSEKGTFIALIDKEKNIFIELSRKGDVIEEHLIFHSQKEIDEWLQKDIELPILKEQKPVKKAQRI